MIASAHLAAGVFSGMLASRLERHAAFRAALGFGFGLISHLLLDGVPHGDYGELGLAAMVPIVGLELVLGALIFTRILRDRVAPGWPIPIASGMVGASIPDIKFPAALFLPDYVTAVIAERGDRFHSLFHATPATTIAGTAAELLATATFVAMLFVFPKRPSVSARR